MPEGITLLQELKEPLRLGNHGVGSLYGGHGAVVGNYPGGGVQDARGSPTGEGFLQGAGGLRGQGAGGHHHAEGVQFDVCLLRVDGVILWRAGVYIFRLVTSLGWLAMPSVTTRRMILYVKRSLGWLTMLSTRDCQHEDDSEVWTNQPFGDIASSGGCSAPEY